jgi:hypothetical protein
MVSAAMKRYWKGDEKPALSVEFDARSDQIGMSEEFKDVRIVVGSQRGNKKLRLCDH